MMDVMLVPLGGGRHTESENMSPMPVCSVLVMMHLLSSYLCSECVHAHLQKPGYCKSSHSCSSAVIKFTLTLLQKQDFTYFFGPKRGLVSFS